MKNTTVARMHDANTQADLCKHRLSIRTGTGSTMAELPLQPADVFALTIHSKKKKKKSLQKEIELVVSSSSIHSRDGPTLRR